MIRYELSALVSFILFFMGTVALLMGYSTYGGNKSSKSGKRMFVACISIFVWDFGYGWMGLCYNSDFAYIPRAMALLSIISYMCAVLTYLAYLSGFSKSITNTVCTVSSLLYFIAWWFIIQKDAVTFKITPWGYWYVSKSSPARYLQFLSIIISLILFYVILSWWNRNLEYKREKHLIKRFSWFGPILILGLLLDTLIPTFFGTAAVPGSAIAAFASAMLLFFISRRYMTFGISTRNVSEYVFREVNVPVLILDPKGKIELYNEIAESTFARMGSLKGRMLEEIVEPVSDLKHVSEEYKSRLLAIKGRESYCRLIRSIIYDDFNEVRCEIIFLPDITDAILSMQIADESSRIAENANKAKSNFLANMSHEIRTPMNAIIGMSDIILRDGDVNEEVRGQLNVIKSAGNGLMEIINDILDISKIESGKYEIIDDEYDIAELIAEVSVLIRTRLQGTGIDFNIKVSPDIPRKIIGDKPRVRQILVNLLGNAVKFTQKGKIEFICNCKRLSDDYLFFFDVKDTGIGIREEDINSIFGVFNQVDTRKNRNIQGTGLGLAISKNLAMMMNGNITVESEYGKGSTFYVTIHQRIVNNETIGEEVADKLEKFKLLSIDEDNEEKYPDYKNKNVLVVDDNIVNLHVTRGLLGYYYMSIDLAENGNKAIEMVKNKDYDLIFMDHMMPEMDGVDTTRIIKTMEDGKYKNIPIIALTADAVKGTKEMLIKAGMQDYLAKPINKNELRQVLSKWL
ncbi:MAG: response regulator [Lachnospiraceae bacterium]|nr:response regulator [Lachnospiraceae bacterium]